MYGRSLYGNREVSWSAMRPLGCYEEEFLGLSYGFRLGRGPHDALDALVVGITSRKVNWILDADIQNFLEGTA
jgi:retron-type reverse transcriptase